MTQPFRSMLLGVMGVIGLGATPPAATAQTSNAATRRVIDALDAYYKAHPEKRPEAMAAKAEAPPPAASDAACPRPLYPPLSIRNEEQGAVRLMFLIGDEGAVMDARIRTSSGFPLLDTAAIEGLSKCHFRPLRGKEKSEPEWISVAYVFSLE